MLDLTVRADSELVDKPFTELPATGSVIGAVIRNGGVRFPHKTDIAAGGRPRDRVRRVAAGLARGRDPRRRALNRGLAPEKAAGPGCFDAPRVPAAAILRLACRTSTRCAPRCARTTSARARTSTATTPSPRASSASSPSCATRSSRSTATTRASRRSGARCSTRSRATAAARAAGAARARPRARDHAGLAAARAGGRLRRPTSTASPARCAGVRERLPYLRELGVSYLHLMPLLHARPEPNDGGYAVVDYGAVEPALGHDGRPARAGRRPARARAWRCASTSSSTTPRASTRGRRRRWRATRGRSPSTARSPTAPSPTPTSGRCPRSSPTPRPATSPGSRSSSRWVWTTFNAYQWDLDYTNPEVFVRDGRGDARPRRRRASTCCASTPSPFLWKRMGTNCQNQPEVHELLQALPRGDADRRAGRRLQGRGDRLARATSSRYLGAGRHEGKECDLAYHNVLMVLLLERARLGPRGAADAARCARCRRSRRGAGWVTYVRCHDDIGWAITRGGRRRASARTRYLHRRFLADFYAGDFPGTLRARRALPARPAHRRGAHERHRGVAGRPRGGAGARRRARGRARAAAHPAAATRSRSPTAGCR